jgi:hypothetical protein
MILVVAQLATSTGVLLLSITFAVAFQLQVVSVSGRAESGSGTGGEKMNVDAKGQRGRSRRSALLITSWLLGICLTAAMGWIHLQLWMDGFRGVPVIGPLFLLNAVGSAVLVVALLMAPVRLRSAIAVVTALFTAGTLLGLILSLTVGLFGVRETLQVPLVLPTLIVESAGVVVLVFTAILRPRPGGLTSRSTGVP